MRILLLIPALLLCATSRAAPASCAEDVAVRLLNAQFTTAVRSDRLPADRMGYLSPGTRLLHLHTITRGKGRITYRWFRDGKHVSDAGVDVGPGEWRGWSRLRIPAPDPAVIKAQVLGEDGCLLQELTLPASAFADHPAIREALVLLARGDALGARMALNTLLEQSPPRAVARDARRLLEVDVALAQAAERARAGETFLVAESLKRIERQLGHSPRDRAAREQVAAIRRQAADARTTLSRDWPLMAAATRNLLETQKLFAGDYPLERAAAEQLVMPALQYAGGNYEMIEWQATLRGYRLLLQDKRTGDAIEVTPD